MSPAPPVSIVCLGSFAPTESSNPMCKTFDGRAAPGHPTSRSAPTTPVAKQGGPAEAPPNGD